MTYLKYKIGNTDCRKGKKEQIINLCLCSYVALRYE